MQIVSKLVVLTAVGVALAQQAARPPAPPAPKLEGFVHWRLSDYPAIHAARQTSGMPKVSVERLGTRDNNNIAFYNERRLVGEYPPESHLNYDEIIYIIDGEATFLYGGTQEGGDDRGGTIFGGKIVGGTKLKVSGGDMVSYPAGTPHQWIIENPAKPETHIAIQTKKVK